MNYTISEIKYTDVPTGTQVSTVHPTGTLTLTPKPGYTLTAIDFGWQSTNPYISDVVFTQSGSNLIATIGFEPTFIMPGNNIEIPLCFGKGDGVLINYIVSGSVQPIVGANITSLPGSNTVGNTVIPFSTSGNLNAALTVFTGTLTCAAGYYMPVTPVIVQTAGDPTNFLVVYNDTFAGGLLTARQYTINYTVPNYNSINNIFSITASAEQIYVPVIKITNYLTSNALLAAGGDIRTITIIGNAGANWVLTCASAIILQSDGITVGTTLSGTLGSTGTFDVQISVPPVIINTTYTVVISGDLLSPFPLPTNIVFNQNIDIDVTYTTSLSNLFINSGNVINTGTPQSTVVAGMSGYDNTINWNITPVFGMVLVKQPGVNAWSNLDPDLNNGTSFIMQSISATQVSGSLITINSVNTILRYGLQDMTTTLDLGSFIAHITTSVPTSITSNSVDIGSSVSYGGTGGVIGQRGLCYSTTALPTVANTKLIQIAGFGVRDNTLVGLTPGTTYYVRGYAYNSSGSVFYGNQQTFKTLGTSINLCYNSSSSTLACNCNPGCLDCIPGTEIAIGSFPWTVCNLDVTTYSNGDPIPEVTDPTAWAALTTGAWCYYDNNPANGPTYGKLYNWYAVNDPRGLAPGGYFIPTDEDWTTLSNYLGGAALAGGKMKEAGLCHWQSPNTAATNSSGFTGLPGGSRSANGLFGPFGSNGTWWTSSEDPSGTGAWFRNLYFYTGELSRGAFQKNYGYSVRLLYAP